MNTIPQGYRYLTEEEKQEIKLLRDREYSVKQIVEMTGRSASTVKRLIYNW